MIEGAHCRPFLNTIACLTISRASALQTIDFPKIRFFLFLFFVVFRLSQLPSTLLVAVCLLPLPPTA